MKNRYILDPSGKIKFVNESNKTKEINSTVSDFNNFTDDGNNKDTLYKDLDHFTDSNNEYNQTYFGNQNSDRSFTRYESDILFGGIAQGAFADKIKLVIENSNASFGFVNDSNVPQFSIPFRSLNSFLDTDRGATAEGSDVIPFVDEFEFYTGVREIATEDNVNLLTDTGVFLLDYLADVLVEAAIIEGVILLNKLENSSKIYSSNIRKGSRLDGFSKEKNTLILGEYIFDEVDVFSKYFFEVLNYPIEEGKVIGEDAGFYFLKRLSCFFIGFTEWIVQDRVFDWLKIFKKAQPGFPDIAASKEASPLNLGLNVAIIGLAALDILLTSLTNSASLKRLMLLIKKFHTQKYWVQNQLYSAKRQTKENVIIDSMNYYYFKFFIERVNVGIKIWNREFDVDSVNRRAAEKSKNRLAQEFANKSKIETITFKPVTESAESIRKSIGDNNIDLDRIKNSAANALLKNVEYNFTANYNSFALSEIPSALMFNKSISNVVTSSITTNNKFFAKTENKKLPIELVNKIEKKLESEYMPFYFHDIRTNEIISFHAFIENISDSYSPEYTSSGGFGRIDDVKSYVKTTRSISLSFIVAAMNEEDHDTMWYYINKLVTMVYPQWSRGEQLIIDNIDIQQPFSQVPGNSPLIRLRIGDLIKNNYSRFNLSRIFGLDETTKIGKTFDYDAMGLEVSKRGNQENISLNNYAVFSNPELVLDDIVGSDTNRIFKSKIIKLENFNLLAYENDRNESFLIIPLKQGLQHKSSVYKLKKGENITFKLYEKLTYEYNKTPPKEISTYDYVDVLSSKTDDFSVSDVVEIEVVNFINEKLDPIDLGIQRKIVFKDEDLKYKNLDIDYDSITQKIIKPFDDEGNINNPITQSYESGMSKGLAGHITNLDLNYNDAPWETEIEGSKAPMMVKITMQFAPIHDIPPGLDYKGIPRAVNYNIGNINRSMFGDPLQKDPLQKYKAGNK
jgi:hypothetical protein